MPLLKDWMYGAIAGFFFYVLIYAFIYSIKYDVNLFFASFIIWVLVYVASCFSPLFRKTDAWKRLFREKL